jgi:hypothetical protein
MKSEIKVYVVYAFDYEGSYNMGVFETEEEAKAYCLELEKCWWVNVDRDVNGYHYQAVTLQPDMVVKPETVNVLVVPFGYNDETQEYDVPLSKEYVLANSWVTSFHAVGEAVDDGVVVSVPILATEKETIAYAVEKYFKERT